MSQKRESRKTNFKEMPVEENSFTGETTCRKCSELVFVFGNEVAARDKC